MKPAIREQIDYVRELREGIETDLKVMGDDEFQPGFREDMERMATMYYAIEENLRKRNFSFRIYILRVRIGLILYRNNVAEEMCKPAGMITIIVTCALIVALAITCLLAVNTKLFVS